MATVGLLPEHMVTRVFDALLQSSLKLDPLLSVLPEPIRAGLPDDASAPQQRLVMVLMCLNKYRTPDDDPPLKTFLQWAVKLCSPRVEAAVLQEAVTMLEEGTTTERTSGPGRQRRPWYLGVVKRLYRQRGFADFDPMDAASPIFIGWAEMRARVVGVAVEDLQRTISVVRDHLRVVQRGSNSVEGHIVFPEEAPSANDQETVLSAGLFPVWLDELRRSTERAMRRKVAPSTDAVVSRQAAWAVERCKVLGNADVLEQVLDRTAERMAVLVRDLRAKHLDYVVLRVSTTSCLSIAGSTLLTTWNEILREHRGDWPLYLTIEEPFPLDVDDLLDRVLSEQRVTFDGNAMDSLLSDEQSIPIMSCTGNLALPEARRAIQAIVRRKNRGVLIVPEASAPLAPSSLPGFGSASARVCRFPSDFEPEPSDAA